MDVKFQTHRISLQKKNFGDFVNKVLNKEEVVKTAETVEEVEEETEEVEETEEEVEEETEETKTEADTKEEVKTAEKDEAEGSGQPEAEGKLVNEPDKETGKSGKADNSEAETSGQTDVEPLHQTGESEHGGDISKGTKKSSGSKFIKISKLDSKTRDFLKRYWLTIHPPDYVAAMLAEN